MIKPLSELVEVQKEGRHVIVTFEQCKKEMSADEPIKKIQRSIPPFIRIRHLKLEEYIIKVSTMY